MQFNPGYFILFNGVNSDNSALPLNSWFYQL
jgi:hypothetical protein